MARRNRHRSESTGKPTQPTLHPSSIIQLPHHSELSMAEVQDITSPSFIRPSQLKYPSTASSDSPPPFIAKSGRRPTFTLDDDIIIVREVAATKAHLAPFGEVLNRFAVSAKNSNSNRNLSTKVTSKLLHNRHKKLMEAFAKRDASEHRMSGMRSEAAEDLLSSILYVQKDPSASREAERLAKTAQEQRKDDVGRHLMVVAIDRNVVREGVGKGKNRLLHMEQDEDEGLSTSAASLRETDKRRRA